MTERRRPAGDGSGAARGGRPDRGGSRVAVFQAQFLEDLEYWIRRDRPTALRVLRLVREALRDPARGIGKPEPLKYYGPGLWSRRVTLEDRLVYLVRDQRVDFLCARLHYR